ncbi:MAG: restriction endonuclease [Candidatus Bathyarchaeota archaeon]|nr:MAG: restriction endonuclease [Candidatus Bathyarchaeota archaeon]
MSSVSVEDKAALLMAVKGYECEKRHNFNGRTDLVLDDDSGDKILMRLIIQTKSRSGTVGVDAVKNMVETMELGKYNKGILISKRFSKAAQMEMKQQSIQMLSDKHMLSLGPRELYLKMEDYVNELCKTKCGRIPQEASDCKGLSEDGYCCEIRQVSDNATFHFKRGWIALLQRDLSRLLAIHDSMKK